jgi:hypothetical protein
MRTDTLMKWAIKKLGPSKCKKIKFCRRREDWMGLWDWNGTIRLNLYHIHSNTTMYRTLAHEWTHAQQLWREYKKWDKKLPYDENPLELAARKRERELWTRKN